MDETTKLFLICFSGILLSSCEWVEKHNRGRHNKTEIENTVNAWLGKAIQIDPTVGYLTVRGDSNEIELPSVDFRLIRYIDSEGCTP